MNRVVVHALHICGHRFERVALSGYTIGAFIHVLLVVALVLFLVGLLGGRRLV